MWSWLPTDNDSIIIAMMVASLLPIAFAMLAKILAGFSAKDNKNPREFLAKTTGIASRANAVQMNSYETLPLFFAAIIVSLIFFVPNEVINRFAWLYIIFRVLYGLAYLANLALLRSILWGLSFACPMLLLYVVTRLI